MIFIYYLHATYNQMQDAEVRRRAVYETDPKKVDASGKFSGEADWKVANEIKDREETMTEYVLSLGGKILFQTGAWITKQGIHMQKRIPRMIRKLFLNWKIR